MTISENDLENDLKNMLAEYEVALGVARDIQGSLEEAEMAADALRERIVTLAGETLKSHQVVNGDKYRLRHNPGRPTTKWDNESAIHLLRGLILGQEQYPHTHPEISKLLLKEETKYQFDVRTANALLAADRLPWPLETYRDHHPPTPRWVIEPADRNKSPGDTP